MLVIDCDAHLAEVRRFAAESGAGPELEAPLRELAAWETGDPEDDRVRCILAAEPPLSFRFDMERKLAYGGWKPWFSGKLLHRHDGAAHRWEIVL